MPLPARDHELPLSDVTFVVVDLETTGGSPRTCAITEIGAVKYRGGEHLGTFHTLVNPGLPLASDVVHLTGITEEMVGPAPSIAAVLPSLAEFIGDAVIVGHNVGFDLRFLAANLGRLEYRALPNRVVDTCMLARRLVRDEVDDCKLSTLARHFRTDVAPCHRALDDAMATAELLHHLLERAATFGIVALDDLLALPRTAGHPQVAKLRWVGNLPRAGGVYLFRDCAGRVIYVSRATNLRRRVRSLFASRDRRIIGPLLREAQSLEHILCVNELEAAVLEVRLVREHAPRYNPETKSRQTYRYVKLTLAEPFPRLSIVRLPKAGDGCLYVGPLKAATAALVRDAVELVIPLRRGAGTAPAVGAEAYCADVGRAVAALSGATSLVVDPLDDLARSLARRGQTDDAAALGERARAFEDAVRRQRRLESLVQAGRIEVSFESGGATFDRGLLVTTWAGPERDRQQAPTDRVDTLAVDGDAGLPVGIDFVDELNVIAGWLDERASTGPRRLQIVHAQHGWSSPLPQGRPSQDDSARSGPTAA